MMNYFEKNLSEFEIAAKTSRRRGRIDNKVFDRRNNQN
jgi:hypothetical protein